MSDDTTRKRLTRRDLIGRGALLALATGGAAAGLDSLGRGGGPSRADAALPLVPDPVTMRLAATDGHILLPGRADPLYVFGFIQVDPANMSNAQAIETYKGNVQVPAPIIAVDELADLYLSLTNLGLVVRPDLDDSHTIHWHGFPNQSAVFDGVPEVSIAVPVGRTFPFFYRPRRVGTFMYHCHFEDSEHVQMGMDGIVFVRPSQNHGTGAVSPGKYAYNDGDGSTAYDREFALLLNEIWSRAHDNLESIQENVWSSYKPDYWVINGRSYPDTVKLNGDSTLPEQPISSLIQANPGDRVLLRLANLGYEQHAMELPGIDLKVVGEDATLLRGPDGNDLSYSTRIVYVGPGEARDILFTAPAYDAGHPGGIDPDLGPYNRFFFRNRSYYTLTNGGAAGLGGMATEVRIYAGSLGAQTTPNQTYPS
jgi:FtsP/CotA-like multicopper oxidase with cupredoxin domain